MSRIQIQNLSKNSIQELKQENQRLDTVRGGWKPTFPDLEKESNLGGLLVGVGV